MKKSILSLVLSLLLITGFSQDLNYSVHGKYAHAITKEKLINASSIADIIPDYPVNWVLSYVSVEILAKYDGKAMMAAGTDATLSPEQKNIILASGPGTEIVIDVNYKSKNLVTGTVETDKMHYSTTVVPETEAEYSGGYPKMAQYLKENAIDKIPGSAIAMIQPAVVGFTVNEDGEIANARISKTSGDPDTDRLLLEAVTNMPKWNPAKDSKGTKVRQDFEFSVGNDGC
jgi:TonB family protein